MKRLAPIAAFVALALWSIAGLAEDRLVAAISTTEVQIHSSFTGQTLTFFGNVEPAIGAQGRAIPGPYQVVIVVIGPATDRVARLKTREFGIWLNTQEVLFRRFPSYFHVLSSDQLTDIADEPTLIAEKIRPEGYIAVASNTSANGADTFETELIRLMTKRGHFAVNERSVRFLSDTLYSAELELPADVPNGSFLAQTFLFKDGAVIARRSDGFSVRKTGFERFLGSAAHSQPLLYGLAAVALAVLTGWLGGVVFRR